MNLKLVRPEAPVVPAETKYVIVLVGQSPDAGLFWRPFRQGYTRSLLEAGLYSQLEVLAVERCGRRDPADRGVPFVEALAELRINPEVLDALLIEKSRGGP